MSWGVCGPFIRFPSVRPRLNVRRSRNLYAANAILYRYVWRTMFLVGSGSEFLQKKIINLFLCVHVALKMCIRDSNNTNLKHQRPTVNHSNRQPTQKCCSKAKSSYLNAMSFRSTWRPLAVRCGSVCCLSMYVAIAASLPFPSTLNHTMIQYKDTMRME